MRAAPRFDALRHWLDDLWGRALDSFARLAEPTLEEDARNRHEERPVDPRDARRRQRVHRPARHRRMLLGSRDEQKEAVPDTVEAWGRSPDNPVGGWYGLKKGLRGRFANYVPPVLEVLGLALVEQNPRNNRMRAR